MSPTFDDAYNSLLNFQNEFYNGSKLEDKREDIYQQMLDKYEELTGGSNLSLDAKYELAKQAQFDKYLDLSNYRKGKIIFTDASDPDSGIAIDEETGRKFRYRFKDNKSQWYDAIDDRENLNSETKRLNQRKLVSQLTGKSENELTDFDFSNVKNYQFQEMIGSLTNPNHVFARYDKSRIYDKPQFTEIPILYKSFGSGMYGRNLIDAVNPVTKRSVVFDASQNPYLNANFLESESLDTARNRERFENFYSQKAQQIVYSSNKVLGNMGLGRMEDILAKYDADTTFFQKLIDNAGFFIDKSQSEAYKMFSRFIRRVAPDSMIDKNYWLQFTQEGKDGLTLADRIAGVQPELLYKYTLAMRENAKAFEEGRYKDWLVNTGANLDSFFADSLPQMTGAMASSAAGAYIGATLGSGIPVVGTIAGALVGFALGSFFTACDETFQVMDDYEANNRGQAMPTEDILKTFAYHYAFAMPETLLGMIGIGKLLPKAISQKFLGKPLNQVIQKPINPLKGIAIGAGEEFFQEGGQNAGSAYFSQDQENWRNFYEIATDKEQLRGALIGGIMGGSLAAVPSVVHANRVNAANRANQEIIEEHQEALENTSVSLEPITEEQRARNEVIEKRVDELIADPNLSNLTPSEVTSATDNTPTNPSTPSSPSDDGSNDSNGNGSSNSGNNHNRPSERDIAIARVKELEELQSDSGISQSLFRKIGKEINKTISNYLSKIMTPALNGTEEEVERAKQEVSSFLNDLGIDERTYFNQRVSFSNNNITDEFLNNRRSNDDEIEEERRRLEQEGRNLGLSQDTVDQIISKYRNGGFTLFSGIDGLNKSNEEIRAIDEQLTNGHNLTQEQKQHLLSIKNKHIENMLSIYSNYYDKINKFASALAHIAETGVRKDSVNYNSGGSFTIYASDIVKNEGTNRGFRGVYKAILEEFKYSYELLKNLKSEDVSNALKSYNPKNHKNLDKPNFDNNDINAMMNSIESSLDLISRGGRQAVESKINARSEDNDSNVNKSVDDIVNLAINSSRYNNIDQARMFATLHGVHNKNADLWSKIETRVNQELQGNRYNAEQKEKISRMLENVNKGAKESAKRNKELKEYKEWSFKNLEQLHNEYQDTKLDDIINNAPDPSDKVNATAHLIRVQALLDRTFVVGREARAAGLKYDPDYTEKVLPKSDDINKGYRKLATHLMEYRKEVERQALSRNSEQSENQGSTETSGNASNSNENQQNSQEQPNTQGEDQTGQNDSHNEEERHNEEEEEDSNQTIKIDKDHPLNMAKRQAFRMEIKGRMYVFKSFLHLFESVRSGEFDPEVYVNFTKRDYKVSKEPFASNVEYQLRKAIILCFNQHPKLLKSLRNVKEILPYFTEDMSTYEIDREKLWVKLLTEFMNTEEVQNKFKHTSVEKLLSSEFNPAINISSHNNEPVLPTKEQLKQQKDLFREAEDKNYTGHENINEDETGLNLDPNDENKTIDPDKWVNRWKDINNEIIGNPKSASSIIAIDHTLYANRNIKNFKDLLGFHNVNIGNKEATLGNFIDAVWENVRKSFGKYLFDNESRNTNGLPRDIGTNNVNKRGKYKVGWLVENKFNDDPALRLFLDLNNCIKNGTVIIENADEVKFNDTVKLAIDYSLREYLNDNNLASIFKNIYSASESDLCGFFGIDRDSIRDYDTFKQFRRVILEHGLPLNAIAIDLGAKILNTLGIRRNDRYGSLDYYEKLEVTIGFLGVKYGEALGLFELSHYDPSTDENLSVEARNNINSLRTEEGGIKQPLNTVKIPKNKLNYGDSFAKSFRANISLDTDVYTSIESEFSIEENANRNTVRFSKKKPPSKRYIKNLNGLVEANPFICELFNKLENRPFTMQSNIINFLSLETDEEVVEIVDGVEKRRKKKIYEYIQTNYMKYYEDDIDDLFLDEQSSYKGKNLTTSYTFEKLFEVFRQFQEEQRIYDDDPRSNTDLTEDKLSRKHASLYFNWMPVRNGRMNIKSSTVNPQSDKFDRFIVTPESCHVEWNIENETDEKLIAYAIAQAFDKLSVQEEMDAIYNAFKKLSVKQIDAFTKAICIDPEFLKKFQYEYNGTKNLEKVENIAQVLLTLNFLKKRRQAIDRGQTKFKGTLLVENDATTSGYDIKLMNIPLPRLIRTPWYNKVGSFINNDITKNNIQVSSSTTNDIGITNGFKAMHEIKKIQGFFDIYKTSAINMYEVLKEITKPEKIQDEMEDFIKKYKKEFPTQQTGDKIEFYKIIEDLLPKANIIPNEDGTFKYDVSSDLRTLMKDPVMVINYTAGLKGVNEKISDFIFFNFIIEPFRKNAEVDPKIQKVMNYFWDRIKNNEAAISYKNTNNNTNIIARDIKELLKHKSASSIKIMFDGRMTSLLDVFSETLFTTYGRSIWEGLEKVFGMYQGINNNMSEMSAVMFNSFNEVYNQKIAELNNKYSNDIPIIEYKKMLNSIKHLLPCIKLPYEKGGIITMVKTEKAYTDRTASNGLDLSVTGTYDKPKNGRKSEVLNDIKLRPNIKRFVGPGKGGAVVPVHTTDGMGMAILMNYFVDQGIDIVGVHDAAVHNAKHALDIPTIYNAAMPAISYRFNMYENILNNLVDNLITYYLDKDLGYYSNFEETPGNSRLEIANTSLDYSQYNIDDIDEVLNLVNGGKTAIENYLKETTLNAKLNLAEKLTFWSNFTKEEVHRDGTVSKRHKYMTLYGIPRDNRTNKTNLLPKLEDFESDLNFINSARQQLFSQVWTNSNMDGFNGSGVLITPDFLEQFNPFGNIPTQDTSQQIDEEIRNSGNISHSSPNGFVTNPHLRYLLDRANTDPNARIELFDKLVEMSRDRGFKTLPEEHLNRLKELIKKINPLILKNLVVNICESNIGTVGKYNNAINTVSLGIDNQQGTATNPLDYSTWQTVYSIQTLEATYGHELIHAGLSFAKKYQDIFGCRKEFDQLMRLQKYIIENDIITPEDFMPDSYDPSLEAYYRIQAEKLYNHAFNNSNGENFQALEEFVAVCLTHPKVVEKLQNAQSLSSSGNILINIFKLVKSIFQALFGDKTIKDVSKNLMNIVNSKMFKESTNLMEDLEMLTDRLFRADEIVKKNMENNHVFLLSSLYGHYNSVVKNLDKVVRIVGDNIFNLLAIRRPGIRGKLARWMTRYFYSLPLQTDFQKFKKLIAGIVGAVFSPYVRNGFANTLMVQLNMCQQGFISTTVKQFYTPDTDSSEFEKRNLLTRQVDAASKARECMIKAQLLGNFDKEDLTYDKQRSLLYIGMATDLWTLGNSDMSNISEIKGYLTNQNFLNQAIATQENTLINMMQGLTQQDRNWVLNQGDCLAYYMISSLGNEALNLNAYNIAQGNFYKELNLHTNKNFVKALDKYITLKAIEYSDPNLKLLCSNISDRGLSNFLKAHKEFVNESLNGVTIIDPENLLPKKESIFKITPNSDENLLMQKGYFKHIYNKNKQFHLDKCDPSTVKFMESYGFKLVKTTFNKTSGDTLGVYIRDNWEDTMHRDGTAYIMEQNHSMGQAQEKLANLINQSQGTPTTNTTGTNNNPVYNTLNNRSLNIFRNIKNQMTSQRLSLNQIKQISEEGNYLALPTKNRSDQPKNFRFTGDFSFKEKYLEMETDAREIIARMYATNHTKANKAIINYGLLQFLRQDMNLHMDASHRSNLSILKPTASGMPYVKLEPNSSNQFLRDAWDSIPKEIKKSAAQNELWIREDWLRQFAGTKQSSAADIDLNLKPKYDANGDRIYKYMPLILRKCIKFCEIILKLSASQAKRLIVVLTPKVVVGNLISNVNYSILRHNNPREVLDLHYKNIQYTIQYVNDKKEYNRILYKKRIGTANQKNLRLATWYRNRMLNNPVHPLMKAGFYQNIVEDMNTLDLEKTGSIYKFLKKHGIVDKSPLWLKNTSAKIFKWLFMTESTGLFKFFFAITQYSDFVARAVEYQLQMKNAPDKYLGTGRINPNWVLFEEKVKTDILNTFVNYDKPVHEIEQYLNDMGFLMFTKYAKSIQHVVYHSFIKNPVSFMLQFLMHALWWDLDSICEQNVFSKHWAMLFKNPVTDNLVDGLTPWTLQVATGYRSLETGVGLPFMA